MSYKREDIIYDLKERISDYEDALEELREILNPWDNVDPGFDPGLQYEKELEVDRAFNKLVELCKTIKQD